MSYQPQHVGMLKFWLSLVSTRWPLTTSPFQPEKLPQQLQLVKLLTFGFTPLGILYAGFSVIEYNGALIIYNCFELVKQKL